MNVKRVCLDLRGLRLVGEEKLTPSLQTMVLLEAARERQAAYNGA